MGASVCVKMRGEEVDDTGWKCGYCSYRNDAEQSRCLICSKRPPQESTATHYPQEFHFACEDESGYFTSGSRIFLHETSDFDVNEEGENEELDITERAERDNLILKLSAEENLSWAQADLVVSLMDLDYDRDSAVEAARQCSTFDSAKAFLNRECPICDCLHPASKMESMYYCEHSCCVLCLKQHLTLRVRDRQVMDIVCPVCSLPKLGETVTVQEYFAMIDSQLKRVLDEDVYLLLQTKLRDHSLFNDPEFVWCKNCKDSFGFCLTDAPMKTFTCPRCNITFCAKCKRKWHRHHDCLNVKKHRHTYTSELDRFFHHNEFGCPKCETKYSLVRGGCLHVTCSVCKHEWCHGCGKAFMRNSCNVFETCVNRGLHAHHPRNCLDFSRDRDYKTLQKLLNNNRVAFDTLPLAGKEGHSSCPVVVNEDGDMSIEKLCGQPLEDGCAGLCVKHYREYLSMMIINAGVDPVDIMDTHDLTAELVRNNIPVPQRNEGELDAKYYQRIKQMVVEMLPLASASSSNATP